ncbi:hypothetical protein SAMN05444853_10617 [Pasteurella skyensis]|uniref:Uncharacterized protein n=1 Tax=Phocoenobacter skyensis TaxID=97481 RepID=A0A1H7VWS1_9PAST|nr:hypothetical protein SAMN05444853_10617 [Pasteurella skyensis]
MNSFHFSKNQCENCNKYIDVGEHEIDEIVKQMRYKVVCVECKIRLEKEK